MLSYFKVAICDKLNFHIDFTQNLANLDKNTKQHDDIFHRKTFSSNDKFVIERE